MLLKVLRKSYVCRIGGCENLIFVESAAAKTNLFRAGGCDNLIFVESAAAKTRFLSSRRLRKPDFCRVGGCENPIFVESAAAKTLFVSSRRLREPDFCRVEVSFKNYFVGKTVPKKFRFSLFLRRFGVGSSMRGVLGGECHKIKNVKNVEEMC